MTSDRELEPGLELELEPGLELELEPGLELELEPGLELESGLDLELVGPAASAAGKGCLETGMDRRPLKPHPWPSGSEAPPGTEVRPVSEGSVVIEVPMGTAAQAEVFVRLLGRKGTAGDEIAARTTSQCEEIPSERRVCAACQRVVVGSEATAVAMNTEV